MKKFVSVFGLFAKMSFYKIILIFVILSVLQLSLYGIRLNSLLTEDINNIPMLEETFNFIYPLSFLACLCIVCKVLISSSNHSEKTAYTVRRLQIGEKAFFYIQTVYNFLMLFALFAVQAILLFAMCKYYVSQAPSEIISEQSLFLAFYRVDFLHSVLPLDETFMVSGNLSIIIGLSFACALFSYKSRHGKFSYSILVLLAVVCLSFTRSMGYVSSDVTFHVDTLLVVLKGLYTVHIKEEEDEETN